MLKRLLPLFILAILASPFLNAQITTSAISGFAQTATNDPLVGASVVAVHIPSGTKYSTVTRAGGIFNIQNMRVGGPYRVEITFIGFKTERIEDVYLQLAETTPLAPILTKTDATMENVILTTGRRNTILNANRTGALTDRKSVV